LRNSTLFDSETSLPTKSSSCRSVAYSSGRSGHTAAMLMVSLILLSFLTFQAHARQVDAEWPRFQDDAHRVSFAYPPDLHSVVDATPDLGLPSMVKRLSLVSNDPRGDGWWPVLRVAVFICDTPRLNPRVPCRDRSSYRKVCDRFETFRLGDSVAVQCVTYGRAACHWSAIVLRDKGSVEISAPAAEYAANDGNPDRSVCATRVVAIRMMSPVREMLASFRLRRSE
jgi:hypothetical protein